RPSPIGEVKQVCSPGRSKHWPFAPATISLADGGSASTPVPAYCRFVRLTVASPIPRPFPASCQCDQSTECQLRFRTDRRKSHTTLLAHRQGRCFRACNTFRLPNIGKSDRRH